MMTRANAMPKHDFQFSALVQTLEDETFLAEALFFPELTRLRHAADAATDDLQANLTRIVEEDLPPLERTRRHYTTTPEVRTVTLELAPAERSLAWRKPVSLQFHVVQWPHDDRTWLAYVPVLGIEIIATSAEELTTRVPQEIRAQLLRTKAATSLGKLVWLQRCQSLQVETLHFKADLHTPKQSAIQAAAQFDIEAKKSVLSEVTNDLTSLKLSPAFELDDVVARLAEAFTGLTTKSVLLVGKSGVGKTAAVHELVRQRVRYHLLRTSFRSTSGARLIAGMSGFGKWQERCEKLWREAAKEKAILHVGNLVEIMEVGKSNYNSQGIMGFLRPYIARGALLVIAECTPEQIPFIERNDPHLLDAFHRIEVAEPGLETGRTILRNVADTAKTSARIGVQALARLDELHRRYATYSAYPGRPLRFLKNLLKDSDATIAPRNVTAAFSRETGLPLFLLEETVPLDLGETHEWFSSRVIGQGEAVDLVVDLLATVKAGLVRPRKPIASLLFIGPTGTGKTEMAKSLAEFLFQDRHRMVRFDMSEYSEAHALQRLIGGVGGTEGLLTSKVREQPFAVVLLDEIEKAHPQFFDLLLQVLGEGRLTDAGGRVADFCNAVVIMTSNLGAQSYQRGIQGFTEAVVKEETQQRQRAAQHFLKEVRAYVRPELFNRIDRIVPFAPLSQTTVERIAERELAKLKQRDGLQFRGVQVTLANDVAAHLARKGYDARYGARPLKRTIERELLAPLAEQLNQFTAQESLRTSVTLHDGTLQVSTEAIAPKKRSADEQTQLAHLTTLAQQAKALRVAAQRLSRSAAMIGWRNQIYRLTILEKRMRIKPQKWRDEEDWKELALLPRLHQAVAAAAEFLRRITALEDDALLMIYGRRTPAPPTISEAVATCQREWEQLLLEFYSLRFEKADYVALTVVSDSPPHLFQLAHAYWQYAAELNAEVKLHAVRKRQPDPKDPRELEMRKLEVRGNSLNPDAMTLGLSLEMSAPFIFPRFVQETGLQVFKAEKKDARCVVSAEAQPLPSLPAKLTARDFLSLAGTRSELRRVYDADQYIIEDRYLDKRFPWNGGAINARLAEALDESLQKLLQSLLED